MSPAPCPPLWFTLPLGKSYQKRALSTASLPARRPSLPRKRFSHDRLYQILEFSRLSGHSHGRGASPPSSGRRELSPHGIFRAGCQRIERDAPSRPFCADRLPQLYRHRSLPSLAQSIQSMGPPLGFFSEKRQESLLREVPVTCGYLRFSPSTDRAISVASISRCPAPSGPRWRH